MQKNEIRRYLTEGYSKDFIRRALKMPDRTFQWYMSAIMKEDSKMMIAERDNLFMHYARQTIETLDKANNKITILQNTDQNKNNIKVQVDAENLKRNNGIDILRILRDGLGADVGLTSGDSTVQIERADSVPFEMESENPKLPEEV